MNFASHGGGGAFMAKIIVFVGTAGEGGLARAPAGIDMYAWVRACGVRQLCAWNNTRRAYPPLRSHYGMIPVVVIHAARIVRSSHVGCPGHSQGPTVCVLCPEYTRLAVECVFEWQISNALLLNDCLERANNKSWTSYLFTVLYPKNVSIIKVE